MGSLHILIADDHKLFRKGVIAALIGLRPSWSFSEAENGRDALDLILQKNSAHLVLLDVSMPIMDGFEACSKIKQVKPDLPIIILTQFDEDSLIRHFLNHGINGFLLKNTDPEKLVEAIESVVSTGKYVNELLTKAMIATVGILPENKVRLDFSNSDREIIHFLCRGMSTKEIAVNMHLTATSVESYRKDLLHKTHSHNVAELISFAHRTGLLPLSSENKVSVNSVSVE